MIKMVSYNKVTKKLSSVTTPFGVVAVKVTRLVPELSSLVIINDVEVPPAELRSGTVYPENVNSPSLLLTDKVVPEGNIWSALSLSTTVNIEEPPLAMS